MRVILKESYLKVPDGGKSINTIFESEPVFSL